MKILSSKIYFDPAALIDREVNHCSNIFYIENEGQLIAFALYNFEPFNNTESIYFGLTVSSFKFRSYSLAKILWIEILNKVRKKEAKTYLKILCWLTTPNPIVHYWFNKNLIDAEPLLDGTYSTKGSGIVINLKNEKYPTIPQIDENPFILRKVASNTLYLLTERENINMLKSKLNVTAFDNYKINEFNGDRFLMIGYV